MYFLEEIKAFVDLRSVHIAVNRFYSLALFRDFVKFAIWIYDLLYVSIEKAAVCLFPRAHICAGRLKTSCGVCSQHGLDVFYFILTAHSGSFFEIKKNALISSTLKFPLFHALQTLRQN